MRLVKDELLAIVHHHRLRGGKGLEWAICAAIEKAPVFGLQEVQDVIAPLMRAVDEAVSSKDCKDKRAIQRGWVVGLAAGAWRRGLDPVEFAYVMGFNGLLCGVEVAMILAVYAFSLSWGLAQASVRLDWDPDLKMPLRDAMQRGIRDGAANLGGEVEPQELKWMMENLVTGWRAGAFLAKFADRYPALA